MATTQTLPDGYQAPLDHLGTPVGLGDQIAVAFRAGSSAEIRVGTVLGYDTKKMYWEDKPILLLDVEWEKGYVKHSKIETHHARFVKIGLTPSP